MAVVLCATVAIEAAPAPELSQFWDASDETRRATISHREWQELLDAYLTSDPSGINRFDYGSLHANPKHRAQLASYVLRLAEIDPRTYARAEQMAYWINLYNALTVFVIVRRYPVDSIKDISSGLFSFGPWEMEVITVHGQPLTLDDIEHRILRPIWRDPRIHYGVNCASLGCPNLAREAYRSDNLERLLEQGARDYVNHPRGCHRPRGQVVGFEHLRMVQGGFRRHRRRRLRPFEAVRGAGIGQGARRIRPFRPRLRLEPEQALNGLRQWVANP